MMFFNRKAKNRKTKQVHVLDVKLRSDQIRASRMRNAATVLGLVFGTVFCFYLFWRTGRLVLDRMVYENAAFAIEQIDVQTDGVIAPEQLRQWAGVKVGDNLMALDLVRVKRDLEKVSFIRSVAVERVPAHLLRLRVAEREPVAQVRFLQPRPQGGFEMAVLQLDPEGYVMGPIELRDRAELPAQTNSLLPVIAGIAPAELVPGQRLQSPQERAALQLISAFDRSPMSGLVDLQTIDISSPQVLQVRTGQGSLVTFSLQDLDRQLRWWRVVHDQGLRYGKIVATLDFSVPNNIPSTWADAAGTPQPVPPPRNSIHNNRKKNV
jgi:hypothetical protein